MAIIFITGSMDWLGRAAADSLLNDGDHRASGHSHMRHDRPKVFAEDLVKIFHDALGRTPFS
ncbi:hypothetical protein [Bradyrhizobium sp. UFLA05-112]